MSSVEDQGWACVLMTNAWEQICLLISHISPKQRLCTASVVLHLASEEAAGL